MIQILVGIEPSCVRCLIKLEDLVTIERNLFKSIFHIVSQLVARLEEGIAEHIDSINYCLNVVWWSLEILSFHFVGSGEGLGTFCSEPLKVIRFCKLGHCKKHGGLKIYQGNKLIRDSGNLRNVKY